MRSRFSSFGTTKSPFSKPPRATSLGSKARRPQLSSSSKNLTLSLWAILTLTRGGPTFSKSGGLAKSRGREKVAPLSSSKKGKGSKEGVCQNFNRSGLTALAKQAGSLLKTPTTSPGEPWFPQLLCIPSFPPFTYLLPSRKFEKAAAAKSTRTSSTFSTLAAARPIKAGVIASWSFHVSIAVEILPTTSHWRLFRAVPKGGVTFRQCRSGNLRKFKTSTTKLQPSFLALSCLPRRPPRRWSSG